MSRKNEEVELAPGVFYKREKTPPNETDEDRESRHGRNAQRRYRVRKKHGIAAPKKRQNTLPVKKTDEELGITTRVEPGLKKGCVIVTEIDTGVEYLKENTPENESREDRKKRKRRNTNRRSRARNPEKHRESSRRSDAKRAHKRKRSNLSPAEYAKVHENNLRATKKYREIHREELRNKDYVKYWEDPEASRSRAQDYYWEHPEERREYAHERRQEKIEERGKEFLDEEAERLREYRKTEKWSDHLERRKENHNRLWSNHKDGAKKRNMNNDLSRDAHADMMFQPCEYCGTEFSRGIDRVDNDKGYTPENSVTCCARCNMMKWTMSAEDFILVCKHLAKEEKEPHDLPYFRTGRRSYIDYKHCAKRKYLDFEMDEEYFVEMVKQPCHYCRKVNSSGIDRIDNNKGYVHGNMTPCCSTCNYMKKDLTEEVFLSHAKKIASCCS